MFPCFGCTQFSNNGTYIIRTHWTLQEGVNLGNSGSVCSLSSFLGSVPSLTCPKYLLVIRLLASLWVDLCIGSQECVRVCVCARVCACV